MLNVVMLSVIMLNVVMLSVVVPPPRIFYGRNCHRRNSVKIIEKYAASGVITAIKSL
jgi:hypothetical protein